MLFHPIVILGPGPRANKVRVGGSDPRIQVNKKRERNANTYCNNKKERAAVATRLYPPGFSGQARE